MTKVTMYLGELTCPSCLTKIQTALKKQGVAEVKVLFNTGKVIIRVNGKRPTAAVLEQVIIDLGYKVMKVRVKEEAK
ncbi:heavy-metal-associated domain-containing protein [Liquorilactobacillus sp.]|uniref:heavy-metal-associated domain-containing protein n=1 Tax=Liquorilactobacillus sp. TaxID=2767923 RepID=UPI0039E7AF73